MRHPLAAKPIPNEHHQTGTAGANPFQYRFPTFYPPPELTSTTREYPVRIYIYTWVPSLSSNCFFCPTTMTLTGSLPNLLWLA